MSAPLCEWDAAYVLGALPPADRAVFEAHLETCAVCRDAVGALAPLPGLLARVPGPTLEDDPTGADASEDAACENVDERGWGDFLPPLVPPSTLLPDLLAQVARVRRRRRLQRAALGLAAVLVSVLAGVLGSGLVTSRTSSAPSTAVAFAPTSSGPVSAQASVQPVAWGSRIEMSCELLSADGGGASDWGEDYQAGAEYVLEVARGTTVERVASWHALANRPALITAATSAGLAEISELRIADPQGHVLLRLEPRKT
ncbi:MAG: anti-sigma factor family protein [Actinomycetales bacterium]